MITIERKIHFGNGRRGRRQLRGGKATHSAPVGRVPRVSRLMALAIRFDGLIRDGIVADQAEIARLGNVTRARVTQIMNLLLLAPDIQEEILFLPNVESGRKQLRLFELRPVASKPDWREQRTDWSVLRASRVKNLTHVPPVNVSGDRSENRLSASVDLTEASHHAKSRTEFARPRRGRTVSDL